MHRLTPETCQLWRRLYDHPSFHILETASDLNSPHEPNPLLIPRPLTCFLQHRDALRPNRRDTRPRDYRAAGTARRLHRRQEPARNDQHCHRRSQDRQPHHDHLRTPLHPRPQNGHSAQNLGRTRGLGQGRPPRRRRSHFAYHATAASDRRNHHPGRRPHALHHPIGEESAKARLQHQSRKMGRPRG